MPVLLTSVDSSREYTFHLFEVEYKFTYNNTHIKKIQALKFTLFNDFRL